MTPVPDDQGPSVPHARDVESPPPPPLVVGVLPFVVGFCSDSELDALTLVDRESQELCEAEWRLRVLARYGTLRFPTTQWRKCLKLRAYLQRRVIGHVTARVYCMNTRGETACFGVDQGKAMMCSRERAVVYNRCEQMFDLSLRINRSIQEISALIGLMSVDEARGLLNEHMQLMASVASLRSSLLFESELFTVFPAPVLLDANTLLRGTHRFHDPTFLDSSETVMMQVWVSVDGLVFRPLAPPSVLAFDRAEAAPAVPVLEAVSDPGEELEVPTDERQHERVDNVTPMGNDGQPPAATGTTGDPALIMAAATAPEAASATHLLSATRPEYHILKLHELSGMTIHIDDNTLRYRLRDQELCVNALVSNTYLLYLFNPLQFRPMDWSYQAVLFVGAQRYELPVQREGVFLNASTFALRVFLSYGRMPETLDNDDDDLVDDETRGTRGSEDSEPLGIPYNGDTEVFSLCVMATNRITKETKEVISKSACFSLDQQQTTPLLSRKEVDVPDGAMNGSGDKSQPRRRASRSPLERHVHLPFDAMICYCFSEQYMLQYVEFAIGFEALMHQLGVSSFLRMHTIPAIPVPRPTVPNVNS